VPIDESLAALDRFLRSLWTVVSQRGGLFAAFGLAGAVVLLAVAVAARRRDAGPGRSAALASATLLGFSGILAAFGGLRLPGLVLAASGVALAAAWPPAAAAAPGTDSDRGRRFTFLALILAVCALLCLYRQSDIPDTVDFYGSAALRNAARFSEGALAPRALTPVSEGSQILTCRSIPFVAWYTLFEKLSGGARPGRPTFTPARTANLVATLLSILFIERIARRLVSPSAGLFAAAAFAIHVLTLANARSEAISSFSVLVVLAAIDAVFGFAVRPGPLRFVAVVLLTALVAYGIANIRAMYLAALPPAMLLLWRRPTRRAAGIAALLGALAAGAGIAVALDETSILPDRGYWPRAGSQAEHILSPFADGLSFPATRGPVDIPPIGESRTASGGLGRLGRRLFILRANAEYLLRAPVGLAAWSLRGGRVTVPIVSLAAAAAGLGLAFRLRDRSSGLFLVLFTLFSFLGPLIAIWANGDRVMVLAPAHALLAGVLLAELADPLRAAGRRAAYGAVLVTAGVLFVADLGPSLDWLRRPSERASLRRWMLGQPAGRAVFVAAGRGEEGFNFLSWNRARAEPSLSEIVVRSPEFSAAADLADTLGIPAALAVPASSATAVSLKGRPGWASVTVPGTSFTAAFVRDEPGTAIRAWIARHEVAVERFDRPSLPSRVGEVALRIPLLSGEWTWSVELPSGLSRAAILIRFIPREPPARVSVTLDGSQPRELELQRTQEAGEDAVAWADLGGPFAPGAQRLLLTAASPAAVDEAILVGTIAPESPPAPTLR
jgi:hypothetical protein